MQYNKFQLYSLNMQNEVRADKEYQMALDLIHNIEECKTIKQIKTLLKEKLGLTECVQNHKIGALGYLTTINTDKYFEVNITYSNKVSSCIFPKKSA